MLQMVLAREQGTTIEEFEFWNEIGVGEELSPDVYNASWHLKRLTVYN